MSMADWVTKLDAFLKFNEYDVLNNAGKVSHEVAKQLAEKHYETFNKVQDRSFESDFERTPRRCWSRRRALPNQSVAGRPSEKRKTSGRSKRSVKVLPTLTSPASHFPPQPSCVRFVRLHRRPLQRWWCMRLRKH